MANRFVLFSVAAAISVNVFSQTVTRLKEFKAKGAEGITVDRLGNFFLIFKNGAVKKYDSDGKLMASIKNKTGKPTLIEPWYHPSIFFFNRKSQEWIVFDRELKNPQINKLDPSVAVSPYLVCPTNDNKLLVLDKADYSVKKVNRFTDESLFEFTIDTLSLPAPPNFTFMRDYQNMIFLLDKNSGILVFNNIGKLVNRIGQAGLTNFGFYGEEVYFKEDGKLVLFDIYSEKKRVLPLETTFGQSCITDERIVQIDNCNKIRIYTFIDSSKGQ